MTKADAVPCNCHCNAASGRGHFTAALPTSKMTPFRVKWTKDIIHAVQIKLYYVVEVWRSWNRASLMYSFKYNQQDATLYNILYYCQCSTSFRRFLRPSSGAQNCTYSIWYTSSLLLLAWVSWNSPMLAVAASKLDLYQMLCVQFWAPDDGRRNRPKHVEHWQ
jgi:hypothetical protein